ncbi:ELO family [Talaromyces proteolyticus]|uniref:Elongation of fatty acids protein n=1 Tax=Talaromyces proteolyticus TaxID=1131652 RepID=A0AAD4Q5N1_9EURO|nr:ELO family [Talaromyces proteolyticus]KAH8704786.1 ELO family [Talaromyces proteolyticus]
MALLTVTYPFWYYFDKWFGSVFRYPATEFQVTPGVTPMTTLGATISVIVTYYCVVLGGQKLMKGLPAMKLQTAFILHNLSLTVISSLLLILFIEQLLPTLWKKGLFTAICEAEGGWTRELVVLYYLNYITKYIELLDTVFLVLKKKPLTFLHTYHHGATVLLCYTELVGQTSVSWVPITLNLTVHVLMYWYYFQSARGIRVWWKQWITVLQIIQFIIDIGFIYFASYTYFASTYFPWAPNAGSCMGEEYAAGFGVFIITSYLLLFISFYLTTYKSKAPQLRRNLNAMVEGKRIF